MYIKEIKDCRMKKLTLIITLISTVDCILPCPDNCSCLGNTLRCHRKTAPKIIPDATTEVYLTGFNLVTNNVTPFQHENWSNVLKLDIQLDFPADILYLADGIFRGLHNLTYLGLHGIVGDNPLKHQTFNTSRGSLSGIEQVKTLNLSGNELLNLDQCILMLESDHSVPKLENLILTRLFAIDVKYIEVGKSLAEALVKKPIKSLVLDNTTLVVDLNASSILCSTVEAVSLRFTTIALMNGYLNFRCKSLKFIDFSNANYPFFQFALMVKFTESMFQADDFNARMGMFFTTKTLYLNHLSMQPIRFDGGLKFNATGMLFKTQHLQFRQNMLQWFNATIMDIPFLPNSEIDVSDNGLGYIHPRSVDPGKNLVKLDLSHNNLFTMETKFSDDFAIFLNTFIDLEDINMSSNNFSKIPFQIFAGNTKLRNINLSKNKLKTFSFDITNLINLKYINLAKNNIINIDVIKLHMIETFITRYAKVHHNKMSGINMGGNSFVCSCDNYAFMKWMKNSEFLEENNDPYLCTFEDTRLNMKTNALTKTENICNYRKRVQVAIIALTSCFVCIVLLVIVIFIVRKRRIKQAVIEIGMKQIKEGQLGDKFLVFLSYSSDDGDFALDHVYPHLNDEFCALTGVQEDFVCIGETHFRPGFSIMSEIMGCLSKSAVVICLVSRSFCEKGWCQTELEEALVQRKPIILMFKEDIPKDIMPPVMKKVFQRNIRSKVIVGDNGKCVTNPSWSVLCSSILQLAAIKLQDIDTSPDDVTSITSLKL